LTSYLVLVVAFRAIGGSAAHVDVGASFAASSAGRLLTSIPFTPGGVGYTEVGLIGILFAFGAQHSPVVSAVLLYRALSIAPTVLVGAIATVWLGRPQHT
jgi:putative heme transporter